MNIDKCLKKWIELLIAEGNNTKGQVLDEMKNYLEKGEC